MHSLVDYRTNDLDVIYNDLIKLNKIDDKTKDIIEDFINRMLNIDKKHEDCEVSKFF
jgi:predicted PolB exonuclease-like 3'-5' exonuclease